MDRALSSMIHQGVTEFRTGGALGFDTLAALKVLDLREKYPDIRLAVYVPCKEQDAKWSERDRAIYRGILKRADETLLLRQTYTHGCMLERNRAMVDGSDVCIAFVTNGKSGSAYTLRYAEQRGLRTINLAKYLKSL
jgi:uncharacterized phage-like protein YoqJ